MPTTSRSMSKTEGIKRRLPDAAIRALAEAEARRTAHERNKRLKSESANEIPRRDGLDPTRYGDWEVNGLASDF
jgi:hypothetical protein